MSAPYRPLYASDPAPVPAAERRALELWCWYLVVTEEHARAACVAQHDGVAIPVTGEEGAACARFDRATRTEMLRCARIEGVDDASLDRGRRWADRLTERAREDIVARMPPLPPDAPRAQPHAAAFWRRP